MFHIYLNTRIQSFFRPNLKGYLPPKLLIHNQCVVNYWWFHDHWQHLFLKVFNMISDGIKLRMNFKNYLYVWSAFPFKNQVGMHNAEKCAAISSLGIGGSSDVKSLQFLWYKYFHGQFQAFNKMTSLNFQHTDYQHIDITFCSVSSVQSLSRVLLFATPWIAARQASLVHHQLQEFTQTNVHRVHDAIQPSHPQSSPFLLPPIPPSIRVFSNESTLRMRWSKYWSFSFSIIPSKEIPGLISSKEIQPVHSEGHNLRGMIIVKYLWRDEFWMFIAFVFNIDYLMVKKEKWKC